MVCECVEAAREGPKSLEKMVDDYPWIVYNPELSKKDAKSAIHFMCENLVDLVNRVGCLDQASSLAYLLQKVQTEILKTPFERHLAAELHREIRRSTAEDLFYFAYLDNMLMFVEQVPLFFKYHRFASLLRAASGLPASPIENIARFKISNKFGDAEDLSTLAVDTVLGSSKLLQSGSTSGLLRIPQSVEVHMVAVNSESFGYPLQASGVSTSNRSLLIPTAAQTAFFEKTGKQCQIMAELVGSCLSRALSNCSLETSGFSPHRLSLTSYCSKVRLNTV